MPMGSQLAVLRTIVLVDYDRAGLQWTNVWWDQGVFRMPKKHYGICLVSAQAEAAMQALDRRGLCMRKFHADFIVGPEVDFAHLQVGDVVVCAGQRVVIEKVGKPCYLECDLLAEAIPCPLKGGCAFGEIATGDV